MRGIGEAALHHLVDVEVLALGAHATHIQRDLGFGRGQRRLDVVGELHIDGRLNAEVLEGLAVTALGQALGEQLAVVGVGLARHPVHAQPAVGDFSRHADIELGVGAEVHGNVRIAVQDALQRLAQTA